MKTFKLLVLQCAAIGCAGLFTRFASATVGYVTPTSMVITIMSASLIKTDGSSQVSILSSGSYPVTFNKADKDFSPVSLANISVPAGRYIAVSISYKKARSVTLNGDRYDGPNGTQFNNAALIYTTGTSSSSTGSVTSTAPSGGGVALSDFNIGQADGESSVSYFNGVNCIPTDGKTGGCQSTDTVVTTPNMNVIMDLYHSVGVDSNQGMMLNTSSGIYPYAVFGTPGAAIHLSTPGSTNPLDISLIFGAGSTLLNANANSQNGGAGTGYCGGQGFVNASAGPAGALTGSIALSKYTAASGLVQFPASNCNGAVCSSSGLMNLDNVNQAVNSTVNVTCTSDSTGALNYTYTGGAGETGTSALTVVRIVDPSNMLGQCASGTCGSY